MNKQQRDYCMNRVNAILKEKVAHVKAKHTTPAKELTPEQRLRALKRGEFKVKGNVGGVDYYMDVADVIKFNGEASAVVNQAAIDVEVKALRAQADKVTDQLMLGNEAKALELLQKFERGER